MTIAPGPSTLAPSGASSLLSSARKPSAPLEAPSESTVDSSTQGTDFFSSRIDKGLVFMQSPTQVTITPLAKNIALGVAVGALVGALGGPSVTIGTGLGVAAEAKSEREFRRIWF